MPTNSPIDPVPPRQTRPPRMSPLAVLPIFLDLHGKRVMVAGDGDGAVWKAELLAAAGACVEVFTAQPSPDLLALQAAPPAGCVLIVQRSWLAQDFKGAAVAVGALEGDDAEAFARAGLIAGVPTNLVDTPSLGSFNFGTIVNRAPVTIGISTDGAAPVLGQLIRSKIESLLHPALGAWAALAKDLRDRVKSLLPMGAARRDLWRRFADQAIAARAPPVPADIERLFDRHQQPGRGSVALVGAGPGDAELLTLKALRALQSADVIMYDRLVGAEILEMGRREATRILVGKTGGGRSCRQSDINDQMVALAVEGKRVVRLKGGDPLVFGRANEEMAACRAVGITYEVVPGITAALGAAAELGLSLTDRKLARRLQFVTGHSESGHAPDHDWPQLADPWTTTVFYMGARTMGDMLPKLMSAGLASDTPALAISGATTASSRHILTTVSALPTALAGLDPAQPCLIMIGRALGTTTSDRGATTASELASTADVKL